MKKRQLIILVLNILLLSTWSITVFAEEITIGEDKEYYNAFLRETTILLEPGELSFSADLAYQSTKRGNVLANTRNREVSLNSTINIGIFTGIEANLNTPLVYKKREEVLIDETENNDEIYNIGDLIFGTKFLIFEEGKNPFSLISTLNVNIPTGEEPKLDSIGTGSGHWGTIVGLNLVKFCDPAIFFGGISYSHLFDNRIEGKKIDPGALIGYSFGLGFAINDRLTFSEQISGAYVSDMKIDSKKMSGSTSEPVSLITSITYALEKDLSIEPSINFGLNDDAQDFELRLSVIWRLEK